MKAWLCPKRLDTRPISDRVMTVRDGVVNLYLVKTQVGLLCIDTGWRPSHVSQAFAKLGLKTTQVTAVCLTHLHWDHARCLPLFRDATIYVGEREVPSRFMKNLESISSITRVKDQQAIYIGGLTVEVIETPGHSMGSVSYLVDGTMLFSGDTLRLKHGRVLPFYSWLSQDRKTLCQSIYKLADLQGVTCLFTAHSGFSYDCDYAFSEWCESTDRRSQGMERL